MHRCLGFWISALSTLIAMSNISLFSCGSIRQGHKHFGDDMSSGRQCAIMRLQATLYYQVLLYQHSSYSQYLLVSF